MQDAIDIKVLQTLSPERKRHGYRSAGACPPRTFDPNEKHRLARSAGACPPRSLPKTKNVRSLRGHGRFLLRPAHGEGQALALRWEEESSCRRDLPVSISIRPSSYGGRRGVLGDIARGPVSLQATHR